MISENVETKMLRDISTKFNDTDRSIIFQKYPALKFTKHRMKILALENYEFLDDYMFLYFSTFIKQLNRLQFKKIYIDECVLSGNMKEIYITYYENLE